MKRSAVNVTLLFSALMSVFLCSAWRDRSHMCCASLVFSKTQTQTYTPHATSLLLSSLLFSCVAWTSLCSCYPHHIFRSFLLASGVWRLASGVWRIIPYDMSPLSLSFSHHTSIRLSRLNHVPSHPIPSINLHPMILCLYRLFFLIWCNTMQAVYSVSLGHGEGDEELHANADA